MINKRLGLELQPRAGAACVVRYRLAINNLNYKVLLLSWLRYNYKKTVKVFFFNLATVVAELPPCWKIG